MAYQCAFDLAERVGFEPTSYAVDFSIFRVDNRGGTVRLSSICDKLSWVLQIALFKICKAHFAVSRLKFQTVTICSHFISIFFNRLFNTF